MNVFQLNAKKFYCFKKYNKIEYIIALKISPFFLIKPQSVS